MIKEVDYTETQRYLQHFSDQGCDTKIVNHTEGLFNLFWLNVNIIDELKLELEKKKVNIIRLKELISGMNSSSYSSADGVDGDKLDEKDASIKALPAINKAPGKNDNKPKGHGRLGVNDYPGAETVFCKHEKFQEGDTCPLCHRGILLEKQSKISNCRGRNTGYPVPPAQIPACTTNALGSSLEYERQNGGEDTDV